MQINNSTQRGAKIDLVSALSNNQTQGLSRDAAGFASLLRESQTRSHSQEQAPTQAKAQTQIKPPAQIASPAPAPQQSPAQPSTHTQSRQTEQTARDENKHDATAEKADAAKKADADDANESNSDPSDTGRAAVQGGKGKSRVADDIAKRGVRTKAEAASATAAPTADQSSTMKSDASAASSAAAAQPTMDPAIMQWLAGLQRGGATNAAANPKGGKDGVGGEAQTIDGDAKDARGAAQQLRGAELKADADLKARSEVGQDQLTDAASAGNFAQALAETGLTEKAHVLPSESTGNVRDIAGVSASAFATTTAGTASRDAADTVIVALPTPVNSPDFAQTLGVQMSVFARDGVQQAELHLNPADMGPVSVQIEMNGTQAHVAFGADHADTRQAIEAGMPELASALRDAGFTLAGGGVSQHSSGRDKNGNGDAAGDRIQRAVNGLSASDKAVATVSAAARRIVTAGGVDLFA